MVEMNFATALLGSALLLGVTMFLFSIIDGRLEEKRRRRHAEELAALPKPVPIVLRDFTVEELAQYNGAGGERLYTGINGYVFDLSSHPSGPNFYGPDGPYHVFAGRDATIMFAKMELNPAAVVGVQVDSLGAMERDALSDWQDRLEMKYKLVGYLNDGLVPRTVAGEKASAEADSNPTTSSDKLD